MSVLPLAVGGCLGRFSLLRLHRLDALAHARAEVCRVHPVVAALGNLVAHVDRRVRQPDTTAEQARWVERLKTLNPMGLSAMRTRYWKQYHLRV